jgi:hypothetical protein
VFRFSRRLHAGLDQFLNTQTVFPMSTAELFGATAYATAFDNVVSVHLGADANVRIGSEVEITVTDAMFCSSTANTTFGGAVEPPNVVQSLDISVLGATALGACDEIFLAARVSGTMGARLTYLWRHNIGVQGQFSRGNTFAVRRDTLATATVTTTYQITVDVVTSLGATASKTVTVTREAAALPIVTIRGPAALEPSTKIAYYSGQVRVASCTSEATQPQMTFAWTVSPALPANAADNLDQPTLELSPSRLASNTLYTLTLTATVIDTGATSFSNIVVSVMPSPLHVNMQGGSARETGSQSVILLRGHVVDTQRAVDHVYTWTCASVDGLPCITAQGSLLALATAEATTSGASTHVTAMVSGGLLPAGTFVFTLTATSQGRNEGDSQIITVLPVANLPAFALTVSVKGGLAGPSERVVFAASAEGSDGLRFAWSCPIGPASIQATASATSGRLLVLNAAREAIFAPGSQVTCKLTLSNEAGEAISAEASVRVRQGLSGGALSVNPATGAAFETTFELSVAGVQDDSDGPLRYNFFRLLGPESDLNDLVTLPSGRSDQARVSSLPAGPLEDDEMVVGVTVLNQYGDSLVLLQRITVQPQELDTTASISRLEQALAESEITGDSLSAVQVALALTFDLVNGDAAGDEASTQLQTIALNMIERLGGRMNAEEVMAATDDLLGSGEGLTAELIADVLDIVKRELVKARRSGMSESLISRFLSALEKLLQRLIRLGSIDSTGSSRRRRDVASSSGLLETVLNGLTSTAEGQIVNEYTDLGTPARVNGDTIYPVSGTAYSLALTRVEVAPTISAVPLLQGTAGATVDIVGLNASAAVGTDADMIAKTVDRSALPSSAAPSAHPVQLSDLYSVEAVF